MELDILSGALLYRIALPFRSDRARAEAQSRIVDAVGSALAAAAAAARITSPLRVAHFLAQTCHESLEFSQTEEAGSGAEYEGRLDLGNTEPGDGPRYKGRGLIQLTGRSNYRRYSDLPALDLVAQPERAADPVTSLGLAGRFWTRRGLNDVADYDDCLTVSYLVNGGFDGLEARRERLGRAKQALGVPEQALPALPRLSQGDSGAAVRCLQARLRWLGSGIGVDGTFGEGTIRELQNFQSARGLDGDGVVGPLTWSALWAAAGR